MAVVDARVVAGVEVPHEGIIRPHYGTLTALFLLTLPAAVQAQFTFETNNGALTITGYTGPGGAVDIPSTTNGMPVTSIGSSAFFFQPTVASVTIPNSVANIGNSAFAQCYGLTNVVIGTNVTHIGIAAFWYCGLTSVTIPNNVTSIGGAAFYQCYSLTAIAVDALNSVYRSVDGVLFDKSQTKLIQYPIDKIGSDYTIPDGVISIESRRSLLAST